MKDSIFPKAQKCPAIRIVLGYVFLALGLFSANVAACQERANNMDNVVPHQCPQVQRSKPTMPDTRTAGPLKIALIIGNDAYSRPAESEALKRNSPKTESHYLNRLFNSVKDACSVSDELKRRGFTVTVGLNLSKNEMISKLKNFRRLIMSLPNSSEYIFYYSGHGLQIEATQYLAPTDANIPVKDSKFISYSDLGYVTDSLIDLRNILNIPYSSTRHVDGSIIIDACRANAWPLLALRGVRDESLVDTATHGFMSVIGSGYIQEPGQATIILSTEPGRVASDGEPGSHSPFAKSLIFWLRRHNYSITEIIPYVREEVAYETRGKQIVHMYNTLLNDRGSRPFYLLSSKFLMTSVNDKSALLRAEAAAVLGSQTALNAASSRYISEQSNCDEGETPRAVNDNGWRFYCTYDGDENLNTDLERLVVVGKFSTLDDTGSGLMTISCQTSGQNRQRCPLPAHLEFYGDLKGMDSAGYGAVLDLRTGQNSFGIFGSGMNLQEGAVLYPDGKVYVGEFVGGKHWDGMLLSSSGLCFQQIRQGKSAGRIVCDQNILRTPLWRGHDNSDLDCSISRDPTSVPLPCVK